MGGAKPQLGLVRPALCCLLPRQPLPLAVIDVAEPVDGLRFEPKGSRNCGGGVAATAEGAGVKGIRLPGLRNVIRDSLRLPAAELR